MAGKINKTKTQDMFVKQIILNSWNFTALTCLIILSKKIKFLLLY